MYQPYTRMKSIYGARLSAIERSAERMSGGVKVGVVKCGFFWLRLLLRVSTTPTTSLVVVGKAKSEISVF